MSRISGGMSRSAQRFSALAHALEVSVGPHALPGFLQLPDHPQGVVIFAHGSGSGRFSPRNNFVARSLREALRPMRQPGVKV